jgi:hypothetical protein
MNGIAEGVRRVHGADRGRQRHNARRPSAWFGVARGTARKAIAVLG